ncbi:MAG: hypothetical protein LIP23_05190 [Planctomycetes bacterium]|nr:hypothetical protein [Planctomycetota bacterium]
MPEKSDVFPLVDCMIKSAPSAKIPPPKKSLVFLSIFESIRVKLAPPVTYIAPPLSPVPDWSPIALLFSKVDWRISALPDGTSVELQIAIDPPNAAEFPLKVECDISVILLVKIAPP